MESAILIRIKKERYIMDKDKIRDYILENISGVIMTDMEGKVMYFNKDAENYFVIPAERVIGTHISVAFPLSKMPENLMINKPKPVYYHTDIGIGVSVHVPLFENGKRIGLLEYDLLSNPRLLYEFPNSYSRFLDDALKSIKFKMSGQGIEAKYTIDSIIGHSEQINNLKAQIAVAAKSNSQVIITGETGTGKEMVAQAIHNLSERRTRKMISLNAAAIPENLVESELFGYKEGAFTGAKHGGMKGKFELADKSTLFIDELSKLPLSVQPKLLRVLQEKCIEPIGSDDVIPVDVRIIVSTNEDLKKLVEQGKFQADLYYRINVLNIQTPPLRTRFEDLPELLMTKIEELNYLLGKNITGVDPKVYESIRKYNWPGNVRELYNKLEQAMNYAQGDELQVEDFFWDESTPLNRRVVFDVNQKPIDAVRDKAEKELLIQVIEMCNGNKSEAAKYLKINRTLLYQKMKRLGIK